MYRFGKIVVDSSVPFLNGVFEPWFDVEYLRGDRISAEDLRDADALVVRTRTRCNAGLLAGSKVSIIATATIGIDHIDFPFCADNGIEVVSAPGCNAGGVCQYVFAALESLGIRSGNIGVVGVGHVGTRVSIRGREAGFRVLENDPPRGLELGLKDLLRESDVVTVHIPLWDANRNFISDDFLLGMKQGAVLINASRGEVADEEALLRHRSRLGGLVLDVWRNEPHINRDLLKVTDIATPHIAGYSIQGKINGTVAVVRAIGQHFGIMDLEHFDPGNIALPSDPYDIMADDKALRDNPDAFEMLRNGYSYRNELL